MPPRPTGRLNLIIIPQHAMPIAESAVAELWRLGVERGVFDEEGAAGAGASSWISEGFEGARVDRPARARFYHSGLGGLRVTCPRTSGSIVRQFVSTITSWRAGGAWDFVCPECASQHILPELFYSPNAGFGDRALMFWDVQSAYLNEEAKALLAGLSYDFAIVLHRPS